MDDIDWASVWKSYEKEMLAKLKGLPGHREVSEELFDFRSIISHELPETAPLAVFQELIKILLSQERIDLKAIKRQHLNPQLRAETDALKKTQSAYSRVRKSASVWVKKNLPEEKLMELWEKHQTWLPRRYKIYKEKATFERIAIDTLTRFYLIT